VTDDDDFLTGQIVACALEQFDGRNGCAWGATLAAVEQLSFFVWRQTQRKVRQLTARRTI
jgi:hypothetical protein